MMKTTISAIALVSTFLVSNASAFVPAVQPRSTAFRTPSAFVVPAVNVEKQQRRLLTRVMMAEKQPAVMERTETTTLLEEITTPAESSSGAIVKEQEMTESQSLMQKVKDAGTAGIVSYAFWELAFWIVSVPVVLSAYYGVTGHFPDLSNQDDLAKLGAEAFAFVNVARFAVPLRIGLALSTTPWIKENLVDRFSKNNKDDENKNDDSESVENYDPAENMRNLFK